MNTCFQSPNDALSFSRPGTRAAWCVQGLAGRLERPWTAAPAAGMLRKGSSSSAGGGSGTKHILQLPRHHSKPHPESLSPGSAKAWATMGRATKNPSPLSSMWLSSRLMGSPGVDPDYVMQLVNDVRWFADVLISLKDAFQQQGGFRTNRDVKVWYKRSQKHKITNEKGRCTFSCSCYLFCHWDQKLNLLSA